MVCVVAVVPLMNTASPQSQMQLMICITPNRDLAHSRADLGCFTPAVMVSIFDPLCLPIKMINDDYEQELKHVVLHIPFHDDIRRSTCTTFDPFR